MAGGLDASGASDYLATKHLHAEVVAQTGIGEVSNIIINPANSLDHRFNPRLSAVLDIYRKHYLVEQDGIPGEGEGVHDVMLPRLRGEDPNVKAVTVFAMRDDNKVAGMAFVETYEIDKVVKGKEVKGLAHLITYAASEPPHDDDYYKNAAFHAVLVDEIGKIDKALGQEGNSVIVSEVNSKFGYDGQPTSDAMNVEFEIKTGLPAAERELYELGGSPKIISKEGEFNRINIMQMPYIPPALGEDGAPKLVLTNDTDVARALKNSEALDGGDGEPLFLTAETTDGRALTSHHLDLQREFLVTLAVSVGRDRGLEEDAIRRAIALREAGYTGQFSAMDMIQRQIDGTSPADKFPPRSGSWSQSAG